MARSLSPAPATARRPVSRLLGGVCGVALAACGALLPQSAQALITFRVTETAGGIQVVTSGSYILTGLSKDPVPVAYDHSFMDGSNRTLLTGLGSAGGNVSFYARSSGQLNLPLFAQIDPSFAAGSSSPGGSEYIAGFYYSDAVNSYILLPDSGIQGRECLNSSAPCQIAENTTTFGSISYSELGIMPGQYLISWGDGDNQKMLLDIQPVPAPLPLMGAGAAFGWSRRLRRRLRQPRPVALSSRG